MRRKIVACVFLIVLAAAPVLLIDAAFSRAGPNLMVGMSMRECENAINAYGWASSLGGVNGNDGFPVQSDDQVVGRRFDSGEYVTLWIGKGPECRLKGWKLHRPRPPWFDKILKLVGQWVGGAVQRLGFALNKQKTVASITLPTKGNVLILAINLVV
jgi:hypothetical protein